MADALLRPDGTIQTPPVRVSSPGYKRGEILIDSDLGPRMQVPSVKVQNKPFLFEGWVSGVLKWRYLLPLLPEAYRVSFPPRATVVQTLGGGWVDHFGRGLPKFSLTGTFGYLGTLPGGHAFQLAGGVTGGCGHDLYQELEHNLLSLHAAVEGGSGNLPELRFYNLTDEHYWVVKLDRFDVSRSTQRRFLYQYTIEMTGVRELSEVAVDQGRDRPLVTRPLQGTSGLSSLLSAIDAALATMAKWAAMLKQFEAMYRLALNGVYSRLGQLMSAISTVRSAVESARAAVSSVIRLPFAVVQGALQHVDSILVAVASLSEIPTEFVVAMRDTKRTILELSLLGRLFSDEPELLAGAASGRLEVTTGVLPAAAKEVTRLDNPETTIFAPGLTSASTSAVVEASAIASDTVESLAQRHLGDRSRWREIVMLNGLEYPYALAAGQKLLLPAVASQQAVDAHDFGGDWAERAYGVDEALDAEGDHSVSPRGDLSVVGGVDNLSMQLAHRLAVQRGELTEIGHPTYGSLLPAMVGDLQNDAMFQRALLEVKLCLLEDPRVESVEQVQLQPSGTAVYVAALVKPVGQEAALRVNTVIQ